jgi:hypothetical protein
MKILFYVANGFIMPPAMFLMGNFYRFRLGEFHFRKLPISIAIISVTAVVTSLQFVFPEIIPALDRNKEALLSGEAWRLVTPLFIQPYGFWQCIINGIFFFCFLPIAELFYSRALVIIYFVAGVGGQLANYYWERGGGGSSTAIYGVMGSLYIYVLMNSRAFPKGYIFLSVAGFSGATVLCFFQDGHAPALLIGGAVALALQRKNALTLQRWY